MNFENERDGRSRRKQGDAAKSGPGRPKSRTRNADSELGSALRNVYQRTIDEDIPPEMLDLLGKLG